MRLFHLEYHAAVAEDFKSICAYLAERVDQHLIGNEAHRFPRRSDGPYNRLRITNFKDWDAERFKKEHPDLSNYDAFYVGYPPIFAKLYEGFNRPVFMHMPIRFDYGVNEDQAQREAFKQWIADSKNVVVLANNEYEQHYLDIPCKVIPPLCAYADSTYNGEGQTPILWDTKSPKLEAHLNGMGGIKLLRDAHRHYRWRHLASQVKCIIHIPYNVSIMSFHEHYQMGIPMLCPSRKFLYELSVHDGALAEIAFSGADKTVREEWMDYYDFYRYPHIQYFNSWRDMQDIIKYGKFTRIHRDMMEYNVERRESIYTAWEEVFKNGCQAR